MSFEIIVAYEKGTGVIGENATLPWRLSKDLQRFRSITSAVPEHKPDEQLMNAIITGRKTFDSFPGKKPLPGRLNIVITRTPSHSTNPLVVYCSSLDEALKIAHTRPNIHKVFVIGGGQIYDMALRHPQLSVVHATEVVTKTKVTNLDATFPIAMLTEPRMQETERQTIKVEDENNSVSEYSFITYVCNHD
uniref:dihydrofolate reductase n=1 Tax=Clandestinovirus TaxID=2831644 RepID=A0A8F8PN50_9VIRU|nr:dihydrofolate reductase [Clandestinovirus]